MPPPHASDDPQPGPEGAGSRTVPVPDPVRVARAAKAPQDGPRIVFVTGGTALRGPSRALTRYTHNSVHLVTPFDSGGSSAVLRDAFDIPAVGDLRNRLLALAADEAARPLRRLLGRRLPVDADHDSLLAAVRALAEGGDPDLGDLPPHARDELRRHFTVFLERMPEPFDLRGASLGNLVLVAAYLETGRLDLAADRLSQLLQARGRVLATTEENLHLAARLADGSRLVGQHRLTGKQHAPLRSRIVELDLVAAGAEDAEAPRPARPDAAAAALDALRDADLVCYPMGSFFTSVLCNVLPRGVGAAIAEASCPKVYVPSTGRDPELVDTDLGEASRLLVEALRRDAPDAPVSSLLSTVLLDTNPDVYPAPPPSGAIEALGAARIETELVTPNSLPRIDSDRLAQVLVSLAAERTPRP